MPVPGRRRHEQEWQAEEDNDDKTPDADNRLKKLRNDGQGFGLALYS